MIKLGLQPAGEALDLGMAAPGAGGSGHLFHVLSRSKCFGVLFSLSRTTWDCSRGHQQHADWLDMGSSALLPSPLGGTDTGSSHLAEICIFMMPPAGPCDCFTARKGNRKIYILL